MEKLKISTGEMSLEIERNGEITGIFRFNPRDVAQAKRLFETQAQISEIDEDFIHRDKEAKTPLEKTQILEEYCKHQMDKIDYIFGAGSSEVLFGETKSRIAFQSFYDGIIPYYAKASKEAMKKYE